MKTHIAINGACGRMGQRLVALAHEDSKHFHVAAAIDMAGHRLLGQDAGPVAGLPIMKLPIVDHIPSLGRIDAVIDFSSPEGTVGVLKSCVDRRLPLVIATTGHTPQQLEEIHTAAHHTAVLHSPNMSLVVNLLFKLSGLAAHTLKGKGFDVEIIERHHRYKKDAPSGTAAHFAAIIQREMGQKYVSYGREGLVGERKHDEIGIHAIRAGDNVGEHTILFSTLGESLELVHKGTSRDSYARGALLAAQFLVGKGAGMYTMNDVLGL